MTRRRVLRKILVHLGREVVRAAEECLGTKVLNSDAVTSMVERALVSDGFVMLPLSVGTGPGKLHLVLDRQCFILRADDARLAAQIEQAFRRRPASGMYPEIEVKFLGMSHAELKRELLDRGLRS